MTNARLEVLDNVFWHCLAGPHAHFARGNDVARRYAPGISPIAAFPDPEHPDFDALAAFCEPGERFFVDGWSGARPNGWRIELETTMYKMVWDRPIPAADDALPAVRLGPEHAQRAVDLATLTKPGPFGLRTIEIGEWFGLFDGDRLLAMAGERTCANGLHEISGICTQPDQQGRGLAKALTLMMVRRQMLRGELPFLHVASANAVAHGLYLKMGFRDYRETALRVVTLDV